eukprot:m.72189 g.72189  ORF g.72189 m.72189 type:complete len:159 (-) comp12308_c0_seq4:209-685(-)
MANLSECKATPDDGTQEKEKGTPMDRLRTHLVEDYDLNPSDLPKAIVVHETMGIFWMGFVWFACYQVQPAKALAQPLKRHFPGLARSQMFSNALKSAEKTVEKRGWLKAIPGIRHADPPRLIVSLAESALIRNLGRPITVPLKLYLTWKVIEFCKKAS